MLPEEARFLCDDEDDDADAWSVVYIHIYNTYTHDTITDFIKLLFVFVFLVILFLLNENSYQFFVSFKIKLAAFDPFLFLLQQNSLIRQINQNDHRYRELKRKSDREKTECVFVCE